MGHASGLKIKSTSLQIPRPKRLEKLGALQSTLEVGPTQSAKPEIYEALKSWSEVRHPPSKDNLERHIADLLTTFYANDLLCRALYSNVRNI